MTHRRMCGFCGRRGTYDEMPDGTTVYLGILACGPCMADKRTEAFRDLIDSRNGVRVKTERKGSAIGTVTVIVKVN